jgi:hypothetical protein
MYMLQLTSFHAVYIKILHCVINNSKKMCTFVAYLCNIYINKTTITLNKTTITKITTITYIHE